MLQLLSTEVISPARFCPFFAGSMSLWPRRGGQGTLTQPRVWKRVFFNQHVFFIFTMYFTETYYT